jgi:hypothetical protein
MRHEGAGLCAAAKSRIDQLLYRMQAAHSSDRQAAAEASGLLAQLHAILTNGAARGRW